MLKRTLTATEWTALADVLKAEYTAHGDSYVLSTEPDPATAAAAAQVKEFRDNNIALQKQLDDLNKGRPQDAGLAEQFTELKVAHEQLVAREKAAIEKVARAEFETKLREVGGKLGVQPTAVTDLLHRAQAAGFVMKDGAAQAWAEDGTQRMSPKNAGVPLTLGEWITDQKTAGAAHLFQTPVGSGDKPGGEAGVAANAQVAVDPERGFITSNLEKIVSGEVVLQTETR